MCVTMFRNNERRREKLLYVISKLGRIKYDRLCGLIFLANSKGLLKYPFDNKSGSILSSVELRKDLTDLKREGLIVESLEKINHDFDESTHVYWITEYGQSMIQKIKNQKKYPLTELNIFLSEYRKMKTQRLEREIMETIRS